MMRGQLVVQGQIVSGRHPIIHEFNEYCGLTGRVPGPLLGSGKTQLLLTWKPVLFYADHPLMLGV